MLTGCIFLNKFVINETATQKTRNQGVFQYRKTANIAERVKEMLFGQNSITEKNQSEKEKSLSDETVHKSLIYSIQCVSRGCYTSLL